MFSSPMVLMPMGLLVRSVVSPCHLMLRSSRVIVGPALSRGLSGSFKVAVPRFSSARSSPRSCLSGLCHGVRGGK